MLPAVGGERSAKRQSIAYAVLTAAVSVVPFFTGMAGAVYLAGAIVLGLGLVAITVLDLLSGVPANSRRSLRVRGVVSRGWTRRVFTYSITYVAVLFVLFAVSPFLP
jgi:protoheme IX farnesyltransferase